MQVRTGAGALDEAQARKLMSLRSRLSVELVQRSHLLGPDFVVYCCAL